jgi:hypothetical protein
MSVSALLKGDADSTPVVALRELVQRQEARIKVLEAWVEEGREAASQSLAELQERSLGVRDKLETRVNDLEQELLSTSDPSRALRSLRSLQLSRPSTSGILRKLLLPSLPRQMKQVPGLRPRQD